MSYLNKEAKVRVGGAPDCLGDDDEFSDSSSHCKVCPFRFDCAKLIEEKARSAPVTTRPYRPASQYKTAYNSAYTPNYQQQKATGTHGNTTIRPVFNHNKPLLSQYATHVGYDIAKACAENLVFLIESAKDDYQKQIMEDEE